MPIQRARFLDIVNNRALKVIYTIIQMHQLPLNEVLTNQINKMNFTARDSLDMVCERNG